MFLGHLAVGFASKRAAPRAGLAPLMAAALWLDLVWPVLVLAGAEAVRIAPGNTAVTPLDFVHYPWTHSLLTVCGWGAAFGLVYLAATRYRGGAWIAAAAVVSHWLLDLVVHRPDLPLWPGGPRVGLGVWGSVPATLVLELALFAGGVALYAGATRARDRAGAIALWALVAFAAAIYLVNLLGPPPPSPRAVAWGALAQWLFVPWAALIDRHRVLRAAPGAAALAA